MTDAQLIRAEQPVPVTPVEECATLRAAVADGSVSPKGRARLATLLNQLDLFDETIALLGKEPPGTLGHRALLCLAAAYGARDQGADAIPALEAARAAHARAANDVERSAALTAEASSLFRLGRADAAREALDAALRGDPHSREAWKLLSIHLLRAGEAQAVLAASDRLITEGANHALIPAARAAAQMQLGDAATARATLGLDRFLWQETIDAPAGWDNLVAFNGALAAELTAHPTLRYGRHGKASIESWRIDSLAAGDSPLAQVLLAHIARIAERHVAALAAIDHPWIAARPTDLLMRSWCVITEDSGYEQWHMHPFGWLSGVYYVQVPEAVRSGTGQDGCLTLGRAGAMVDPDAVDGPGEQVIRPEPGLLALFPSHTYHRTFPHRAAGKRICVAFDIG